MTGIGETARLLVVDDHADMASGLADYLAGHGYDCEIATSGKDAMERMRSSAFDAVITDLRMPDTDGLALLDAMRAEDPQMPVCIMTAFGSIESALEAVRRGAFHYFSKPLKTEEVLVYVDRAVAQRRELQTRAQLVRDSQDRYDFESMVGRTDAMRRIFDLIDRVADSSAAVLISGESGTGKELIARAIHYRGLRAGGPFVPINCAAIPAQLLESELFGYERGAFTGANKPRAGLAVEATGGTLFLDEIGDLPLELQPKLLRMLQEGEVRPIGGQKLRRVDVRIVAATNASIRDKVSDGTFRKDLFYRLNVVPIDVPPLRARQADLPILADRLLERLRSRNPRLAQVQLTPDGLERLMRYDWPGNVRELENVLERAATLTRGQEISAAELDFLDAETAVPEAAAPTETLPTLREMEDQYIERVLARVGGSRVKAAAILGVDPSTLYRRQKAGGRKKGGGDLGDA